MLWSCEVLILCMPYRAAFVGDHWTTRCPYKDTLQPLQEILDDKKEGGESTPEPEGAKQVTNLYIHTPFSSLTVVMFTWSGT